MHCDTFARKPFTTNGFAQRISSNLNHFVDSEYDVAEIFASSVTFAFFRFFVGPEVAYSNAKIRLGPPVPPAKEGAPISIWAPDGGISPLNAMHSTPQRPLGNHE